MSKTIAGLLGAGCLLFVLVMAACSSNESAPVSTLSSRATPTAQANIPTPGPTPSSELVRAIDSRDYDTVKRLIAAGADVNARDNYDRPLLQRAINEGNAEIVQLLVDAGADVNVRYRQGPPLYTAIGEDNARIVRILLDAGADANARDDNDLTPHHTAVIKGNSRIVRILLDSGADVNARDSADNPPLYTAVDFFNSDIVQILLDAGAEVSFPPNAPRGIKVVNRSETSLTIALTLWGEGIIETHLQVRRRNDTESGEWVDKEVHDTNGSIEDHGLNEDSTYYYAIRACNAIGCSGFTSETGGVTESSGQVDPPAAPLGVEGLKFSVGGDSDDAGVEWTAVEKATYYKVYQEDDLDDEISAPQTSYRDYSPNIFFFAFATTSYRVRACNKAGCSPFSDIVTVE